MMGKEEYERGDLVEWNAGWNDNPDHKTGEPYGWMWRGPYEYKYLSAEPGLVVLCNPGEPSMQDSIVVPFGKIRRLPGKLADKYKNIEVTKLTKHKEGLQGVTLDWSCDGIGFGQLGISFTEEGGIKMDTEAMSKEFVKALLSNMTDQVLDR